MRGPACELLRFGALVFGSCIATCGLVLGLGLGSPEEAGPRVPPEAAEEPVVPDVDAAAPQDPRPATPPDAIEPSPGAEDAGDDPPAETSPETGAPQLLLPDTAVEVPPRGLDDDTDEQPPAVVEPSDAEAAVSAESTTEPMDDEDWFGDEADDEPFPGEQEVSLPTPAPDYDPLHDSPQALRARHWIRGGIVLASSGGALLIGAIVMAASDPCTRAAGNSCQLEARNRAAVVMGVPAAVLIAGGAAALAVGLQQRRRVALQLQAGRGGLGLGVHGRF